MFLRNQLKPGIWDADLDAHPEDSYEFYSHGYKCKVTRNDSYAYCGYVIISKEHPYFKDGDDANVQVHGGITYADDNGTFGFDCLHWGDLSPLQQTIECQFNNIPLKFGLHYWTFEEAMAEVENMAKQFRDADIIRYDEPVN